MRIEDYNRACDAMRPALRLKTETASVMGRRPRRRWPVYVTAAAAALALVVLLTGLPLPRRAAGPVEALRAYAISEPEYPDYPMRINSRHQEREGYSQEYREYREELGLLEEFDEDFAGVVGDFSAETSRLLLTGAEGNRLYSPVSFWIALGMLAEVTGGESRQQILDALGVEDQETLRSQTQALWRRLYRDDGVSATRLASSLWLNQAFTYAEEPLDILADYYYAGSYRVEMGTEEADKAIAAWIDAQTENLLQESTGGIKTEALTALRLYSTIYYYGGWTTTFNQAKNTEDIFTLADGREVTATFMHRTASTGSALGGENFIASSLGTENRSIYFVLPDEGVTVDQVLENPDLWSALYDYSRWESRKVEWSLPKFDVQSDLELGETMEAMGITDVFREGAADFSPLVDEEALAAQGLTPPVLNVAHQAARLQVDEEGVRAVAYTELGADAGAALPPDEVVVMDLDRPFLVIITSPVDGVPLFVGVINDPTA